MIAKRLVPAVFGKANETNEPKDDESTPPEGSKPLRLLPGGLPPQGARRPGAERANHRFRAGSTGRSQPGGGEMKGMFLCLFDKSYS